VLTSKAGETLVTQIHQGARERRLPRKYLGTVPCSLTCEVLIQ